MVFGKLLKRLTGKGSALKLIVDGVVTEVGRHTPRTHLGPAEAAEEAYFGVDIRSACLSDGSEQSPASIVPAEFSGAIALLDQFAVGDQVRITATTASGRLIESMVKID